MASSSGSGMSSSALQNSGSEGDLRQIMDQRKRKRMISNRESARRSRMRKQKHLDDLMAQVTQLRKENNQIITSMNITTQHYLNVEAENSILRAQLTELTQRLQSLNEIINFLNATAATSHVSGFAPHGTHPRNLQSYSNVVDHQFADGFLNINNSSWDYACVHQPIMASAEMVQY